MDSAVNKNNRSQLAVFLLVAVVVSVLALSCSRPARAQVHTPEVDVTVVRVVDDTPVETIGPCQLIRNPAPPVGSTPVFDVPVPDDKRAITIGIDCTRIFADSFE